MSTNLIGKYIEPASITANLLAESAKQNIRAGKLAALRNAVANLSVGAVSSIDVTTEVLGAAVTDTPRTALTALGIYVGAVSGASDPKRVLIRYSGTDNGVAGAGDDDVYGVLTESGGVYTLDFKNANGTNFTFPVGPTLIDFLFVEIFDLDSFPVDSLLRLSAAGGVVDSGTAASLSAHLNGGTNKHDANEIDYERADGSKKNIDATSDDVESALSDLDDTIGSLAQGTNYTASNPTIVADHLAAIDSALAASGLAKPIVRIATVADLGGTYNNGTAGVGATITALANGAFPSVDGITLSLNDDILVKNQSTSGHNGVYRLTQVGDAGNPWILTRRTDCDSAGELRGGVQIPVKEGTENGNKTFVLQDSVTTVGTTGFVVDTSSAGSSFTDAAFTIQDEADTTKQLKFQASGITSGQIRTITAANRDVNLDNIVIKNQEIITLTSTDITNKYVVLAFAPKVKANTKLQPAQGIPQTYGVDYQVTSDNSDRRLSWDGLGLDGVLANGEVIIVDYSYNG